MISDERIERAAILLWSEEASTLPEKTRARRNVRTWPDNDPETHAKWRRLARSALTADAPEIAAAEIRGLEMAKETTHAIGMAYVAQKLGTNASRAFADRAHMASRCAAEILDVIDARIAELKAKTEPGK